MRASFNILANETDLVPMVRVRVQMHATESVRFCRLFLRISITCRILV